MQLAAIRSMIENVAPMILDGGLGSELDARGYDVSSALWSAELVRSHPDAILQVHRAYLDAGAHCIIGASYQASIPGFETAGYEAAAIQAVFRESIAIAQRARDEFLRANPDCGYRPLVAASIGPYGAYLADGSEYRGNYGVDDAVLRRFHAERLRWLDESGADLLACETIPDLQEARVLAQLLASASTPSWVSFCCRDAQLLQDGNSLEDAVGLFQTLPSVFAVGVNCCQTGIVEELIRNLRTLAPHKLIVVYPNSGAQYDAATHSWHGQETARQWSQQAAAWSRAGASIIGGCCRIGPEHIRQLAKRWS